jgi:hypothetical protein
MSLPRQLAVSHDSTAFPGITQADRQFGGNL